MRVGTRRSALALAQADLIAALLGGREIEIVPIATSGDRGSPAEDKSRWVRELEQALCAGQVDLAVHSAKDVPGELADGLELLGAPPRGPAEDVLCGAGSLDSLSPGARVGTSSLRRMAQLRAARGDLELVAVRGNVDTRLRKLDEAEQGLDAIVLARAGLQRLGLEQAGAVLDAHLFVPAPGQGVIVLEGRADDDEARDAAAELTDADTFTSLVAERALARELQASCHTPLGAHARTSEGALRLRAWVGLPDGSTWIADERTGDAGEPGELGRAVAERMRAVGGVELLRTAEVMAGVGAF